MGVQFGSVAAVDLRVAVHRRRAEGPAAGVLHSVHRDEPVHYVRDGDRGVLCARDSDGVSVLQDMVGDAEATEGPAEFAGWEETRLIEAFQF